MFALYANRFHIFPKDSQNNSARSSDEPASSSLPLIQPGSHRGVSRIRDDNNEAKMVSRSAQYMRNVNNRTVGMGAAGSQDAKKISPLVTQSDLSRAVQHSPSQGKSSKIFYMCHL